MLFAPVPAVEAPAATQAEYDSAVADRLAGRFDEAAAKLERILASDPSHVDARLNLGLVRLAQGRLDDAQREFRRVLSEAPGYADAREGLAAVERRRAEARNGRVDFDYARSRLSAGLPDWTEARLSVSRTISEAWSLSGGVEHTERFGFSDLYLEGRADRRLERGGAYVAIGGAPSADYRPEIQLRAGAEMTLAGPLAVSLDAGGARFAIGTVTSLQPGAGLTLLDGRLGLRARWINTWDENDQYRSGYAVSAALALSNRFAVRLGYADAPESAEGRTVDVTATSAAVEVSLGRDTLLRIGGAFEDRGAYDRKELSVGIGRRF